MATVREMMMQDAAASIETSYMMAVGDTFEGTLDGRTDEDWVAVELEAGTTYEISLTGSTMDGDGGSEDTVLTLYDAKGGMIDRNDDINPSGSPNNPTNRNSKLQIAPLEDGTYYISAGSYSANPEDDNSGTYTISVVALDLPSDVGGTADDDKIVGTDDGEEIEALAGDDTVDAKGGDDTIDGGPGNDLITGGPGADDIMGGDGDDTIAYAFSPMAVRINLRAGTASGGDAEGDTIGSDIENVRGTSYDDMLSGSRGANSLWGLGGNDALFGDKGDDMLSGGRGDDDLDGGDGDDVLEGGYGADLLTGGGDTDEASYAGSMMGVTVRLHTGQTDYGDAEGDTWGELVTVSYMLPDEDGMMQEHMESVPDIINLRGSAMADILAGDSRDNEIWGGGGNDDLYGGPGGGDDVMHGGMGDDRVFGGHGDDTLYGDAGDDMLHGGPGDDRYYGGAGSDLIYAGDADSIINGWVETPPTVDGTPTGTPIEESAEGGDPMAVDTVSYEREKTGVTKTLGAGGISNIENIIGTEENDTLTGSDGNNVIDGRDGADALDGGTGEDTLSYKYSDRGVTVNLEANTVSGGHAQGDSLTDDSFENATGSAHDDTLTGDESANKLSGLAGDDELIGGLGSDTLEGGAGADELDGGTSDASTTATDDDGADTEPDTLSYAGSDEEVYVNLATVTVSGGHADGDDIEVQRDAYDPDGAGDMDPIDVATFENVTGSAHNDRLTGDHRMNTIMGGDGNDIIAGGGAFDVLMGQKGDDHLRGEAGSDHLVGGPGADTLDGGEVRGERNNMIPDPANAGQMILTTDLDWAVYRPAEEGVEVNLSTNRGTGGDAMGDRLIGIEVIWGSKHDDTFIASADEDTHDIIHGDSGADTVSYEASETGVMVNLAEHNGTDDAETVSGTGTEAAPFVFTYAPTDDMPTLTHVEDAPGVDLGTAATNGAFGDRLGGIQNLTGSDHNDTLTGDDDPNVLKGGGGNDTLSGGGSNDTLEGGAGRDTMDGGAGIDMLTGGAGDDELTGGSEADTFVFAPGHGDDIINDLVIGTDRIDLSAFNLDAEDLAGMISTRGTGGDNPRVVIDLTSVGGGTIELTEQANVDTLDESTETGETDDGVIQILNVYDATDNTDGVFIL